MNNLINDICFNALLFILLRADRSGGIRGFIRIHKTPPARRRKKDLEVKNNGETVALTLAETQVINYLYFLSHQLVNLVLFHTFFVVI